MRTTVDLPDDLHSLARELAHQQQRSFSDVVVELIRLGLDPAPATPTASTNGLPRLTVGRRITAEDVRELEDDG